MKLSKLLIFLTLLYPLAALSQVTWTADGGTVTQSGLYSPPSTPGTYTVTAGSGNSTASSIITVPSPVTPPVSSCETEPLRTTGAVYYVCDCQAGSQAGCVAGNDSGSGTSPSTPWKSWSKAMTTFSTMPAGSTVAMCKGGSWRGLGTTTRIQNANCTRSSTCDLRDYSPTWGGTNKPIVQFSSGEGVSFGWYEDWSRMIRGFRIMNLDFVGNSGQVEAVVVWGGVDGLEICGNTFRDGLGAAYAGVTTITIFNMNFHHNRVTNNPYGIGVIQGPSCMDGCVIADNYFDNNGGNANRDHTIYIGNSPTSKTLPSSINGYSIPNPTTLPTQGSGAGVLWYVPSHNLKVLRNQIRNSATGGTGVCGGSQLVGHGAHEDLVVQDNVLYQAPGTTNEFCFGIDLTAGIDMPKYMKRTIVSGNKIYGAAQTAINGNGCQDCVVENNEVFNTGAAASIVWPDPGNICTNVPYPSTATYTCSNQLTDTNNVVRNNTFHSNASY